MPAFAQDEGEEPDEQQADEQQAEDSDDQEGDSSSSNSYRPPSGSLFGGARPPQTTTSEDDLTGGDTQAEDEAIEDDRIELLVFDLYYEDGITFRDRYFEQFEEEFWEAINESPSFRGLTPFERQRRMTQAAQLSDTRITDERAEEIAVGIEAPYYLIPRVEIEGSSQYRISITLGQAGHGDEGRTVFSNTVGRRVDYVERTLGRTAEEAVAGDAD